MATARELTVRSALHNPIAPEDPTAIPLDESRKATHHALDQQKPVDRTVDRSADAKGDTGWHGFLDRLRARRENWRRHVYRGEIARGGMGAITASSPRMRAAPWP